MDQGQLGVDSTILTTLLLECTRLLLRLLEGTNMLLEGTSLLSIIPSLMLLVLASITLRENNEYLLKVSGKYGNNMMNLFSCSKFFSC